MEDIGADIGRSAGDIGIGLSTASAGSCNEWVAAVNRLQVHGLPDRAAFGVEGGKSLENLGRAGFARFMNIESFAVTADLGAHGLRVDKQAGEPEVGDAVLHVVGVHGDREITEAFTIALIDGFLLDDVFIEVRNLAPDNAGNDVGHAVVVTQFFVLVPGGSLTGLGRPLADLVGVFLRVCQEHAAGGTGDDLVAVEGDAVIIAEGAGLLSFIGSAEAFGSVFDNQGGMGFADGPDFVHFGGGTVKVGKHNQSGIGVEFEGLLKGTGVHVPGVVLGIDENSLAVLIGNGVNGRIKSHVRAEDAMAGEGTGVRAGLAVELFARESDGQVKGGGAGGEADGIAAADIGSNLLFDLVDVGADGGDPVGADGLVHPSLFIAVHGGRGKPDFVFKRGDPGKARIGKKMIHSSKLKVQSLKTGIFCCSGGSRYFRKRGIKVQVLLTGAHCFI